MSKLKILIDDEDYIIQVLGRQYLRYREDFTKEFLDLKDGELYAIVQFPNGGYRICATNIPHDYESHYGDLINNRLEGFELGFIEKYRGHLMTILDIARGSFKLKVREQTGSLTTEGVT